jgi:predicted nuclease with TOPRIM domain
VLPLINAVQEQQQTIDELKSENEQLEERLLKLEKQFEQLKKK